MKKNFVVVIFFVFLCQNSWGGGATQRRNVRVNRRVTANPQPPALPVQKQSDEQTEEIEKVSPPIRRKEVYSPAHVLVSSPDTIMVSQAKVSTPTGNSFSPQLKDDLVRLVEQLDESSIVWVQIKDARIQMLIVSRYIDIYRQQGVNIKKAPLHYVKMVNMLASNDPKLLTYPFAYVLRTVAIMEYDFDNGEDKDLLSRKLFGPDFYKQNKKRLGRE